MRAAPPLALSAETSRSWRISWGVLSACAAATLAAWIAGQLDGSVTVQWAAATGAAMVGAAFSARLAGPSRVAEIAWDGREWRVDGVAGRLDLMLDAGRTLMLLRLRSATDGRSHWRAIAFVPGSEAPRALRTALYSSAPLSPTPEATGLGPPGRAPD